MTQLDRLIGGVNRYAFTLKHIIASANTNDECKVEWLGQFFSWFRQIYVIARVWGFFFLFFLAPRNSAIAIPKNLTRSKKRPSHSSRPSVRGSSRLFGPVRSTGFVILDHITGKELKNVGGITNTYSPSVSNDPLC